MYEHHVKYYETDQMGIVHHSNFIRWMEEARCDMLQKIDLGYGNIEKAGILSPVLGVSCEYKRMVHFEDTVQMDVWLKEYGGVKFTVGYAMYIKGETAPCCTAESRHCFLTKEGRPASMKRVNPEWDEKLRGLIRGFRCGKWVLPSDSVGAEGHLTVPLLHHPSRGRWLGHCVV